MAELRLGIIGVGTIAELHIANIKSGKCPRINLVALADERLDTIRERHPGHAHYKDASEMIRSGTVDAVLIATPHFAHTTIGIEALEADLHVLVEKPISVHKADCERLLAAHKGGGQIFAAMFNQRTDPHYTTLRRLIRNGDLGAIQRINWTITHWFRPQIYYDAGGWRATWKGEGGGVLINQCPHQLDLWWWLFGAPRRLRAFAGLGKRHHIEVEDEVTAYMEYENGATGVFITSTGEAPGSNRLEIAADNGRVVLEDDAIRFLRNETPASKFLGESRNAFGKPEVWDVTIPIEGAGEQHAGILKNFTEAVLDGAELLSPAEEGIHSVELANAMLFSSMRNETVEFPLDGAAFEAMLKKLGDESAFQKRVAEPVETDLSKSFS